MTEDDLLSGVLEREGGWRGQVTRPNGTIDPPTNKGITFPTLKAWAKRKGQPEPTLRDLRFLSDETARAIYQDLYVDLPKFTRQNVPFEPLRVQLIDFGINSGPERATRWLQRVMRMPAPDVDGKLGPQTAGLLQRLGSLDNQWGYQVINDALVAARSYMIDQSVDTGAMRKEDEEGVESRALGFFLARP
jgi:lysozyme family protein